MTLTLLAATIIMRAGKAVDTTTTMGKAAAIITAREKAAAVETAADQYPRK